MSSDVTLAVGVISPTITVTVLAFVPVTGNLHIFFEDSTESVSDLTKDDSGIGWTWTAAIDTLTLTDEYGGEPINIDCDEDDLVNLVYSGDVSLSADTTDTISCNGSLNISESGSKGTLNLENKNTEYKDLQVLKTHGALTISSGTILVSGTGDQDCSVRTGGEFTVGTDADVTITSIKDAGIKSRGCINISGALNVNGGGGHGAIVADDVFVIAGKLTTKGDINGSVTVSGGTANIDGDITDPLTVTNGIVTVTGTVYDSVNVIAGTVTVNGKTVTPLSYPNLVLDASATGENPFRLGAVTGSIASVTGYSWDGTAKKLTLSGLSCKSDAAIALHIVNGDVEIVLASRTASSFVSTYSGNGDTYGIYADGKLTISGSGALAATSGTSDDYSVGIASYQENFTVNGGVITATGGSTNDSYGIMTRDVYFNGGSVIASMGISLPYGDIFLPAAYTWWANTASTDPGGAGTDGAISPFENDADTYRFVKLEAPQAYTVTFNLNGGTRTGGGELTQTVVSGGSATAPTVTLSRNTFTGWDKDIENVTGDLTVTAKWSYNGGGSSGGGSSSGGSSGGGSSTKVTITTETQPNQPITAAASVTATAGTNDTANASIADKAITDAISKAKAEAKKQGKSANGISVGLNITMPKGATTLTATLTQNALNSLVSAGVTNLQITGSPVTITFDLKALKQIQKQSSGNMNIAIAPQANLSETAKRMIGSRPVYNITVGYGDKRMVSSFRGGVATVAIPYTPANDEDIGGLYAAYVDENGNASRVSNSAYDENSGCVIFTTTHLSMYGVGYSAPSTKFTDISSHWAKESIDYVVGRGLLSGTSETTFAPNTAMTRGMLVTALGRLEGVYVSSYTKSSFTDVKVGSAFQPYIEWAYKKGIIQGIGNNQFAPDRAITREEIAVIVTNFTNATGYTLPVAREATTYADASSIGSNYKNAVTAMQQAGIMTGGTSNKFNPKANATRAEVSSMLHRYIKLTIDD